ncbi:hypothetical protein D9C01_13275, partial [Corynebacterium diphtheriae]
MGTNALPGSRCSTLFASTADRLGFHVRDAGLLESALARPATVAYGREVYASFPSKATAFLESLTRNRGLLDGNKRTAWVALQHFVRLNG